MEKIKENLGILIFALYNFKNINEIILSEEDASYLKIGYDLDERKAIYEALIWAMDNPDFKFENIMENTPVVGKLPFSNEEIYDYLSDFKIFMEKDNGLLNE